MKKISKNCYILCNISNPNANYCIYSPVGNNLIKFVGKRINQNYKLYYLNTGGVNKKNKYLFKHEKFFYNDFTIVEFPHSFSFFPNRFRAKINIHKAIRYLLKKYQRGDKILIYHSLSYSKYYKKLTKKIDKKDLILLVAEFYSEVLSDETKVNKEIIRLRNFKKIIVMSKKIIQRICVYNKDCEFIFLYGNYNLIQRLNNYNDGKIHLVYAGTSSKIKGGLFNALSAMDYLPDNYFLHIYSRINHKYLIEVINNTKNTKYEGLLEEDELNYAMSKCDIGLALQNPTLNFNSSSFPSKITNYMGCGLLVVSSKSISVIESPFNRHVNFADVSSGMLIAKSIIEATAKLKSNNSACFIKKLDRKFIVDLSQLLAK